MKLRPRDVLRAVPGLQREELLRWTKQGYLSPAVAVVQGRRTSLYTESEVSTINQAFVLVHEGYSPRAAFRKVSQGHEEPAAAQTREPAEISYHNMRRDFEKLKHVFDEFAAKYKLI